MPALAKRIEIDDKDRAELERIVRSTTQQVRMVERAHIVLSAAEGRSAAEIGRLVGCSVNTAQKWRSRYQADGLAGLGDLPRSGETADLFAGGQGEADREGVHASAGDTGGRPAGTLDV
jgi:hypothetical protein